jgi:hypothetical protein
LTDEPGTCPTCSAPLVKQTDRRKARGFSVRCSAGGHKRPSVGSSPRKPGTPRRERPVGTQTWMTDPSGVVCRADACFWDAATCPAHGRKN